MPPGCLPGKVFLGRRLWGSPRTIGEILAGLRTPGDQGGADRIGWEEECLGLPAQAANPVIFCCVGLQEVTDNSHSSDIL